MLKALNKKIFVDNKKITGIAGMITIFILAAAVFSYEASAINTLDAKEELAKLREGGGTIPGDELRVDSGTESFSDNTMENSQTEKQFDILSLAVIEVEATLTWNDESPGLGRINEPDEFKLSVTTPSGIVDSTPFTPNSASGSLAGSVNIVMPLVFTEDNSGTWTVMVEAGNCGDITGRGGFLTFTSDDGNNWDLNIKYSYYVVEEGS